MASRKKSTRGKQNGRARKQQPQEHHSLVGRVARSIRMRIKNLVS